MASQWRSFVLRPDRGAEGFGPVAETVKSAERDPLKAGPQAESLPHKRALPTCIEIGGVPILVRTESPEFFGILQERYGGYVNPSAEPLFALDVEIVPPGSTADPDAEVIVRFADGRWVMERGDFYAEWNPGLRCGYIRQAAYPYAMDAVLRILHSLLLARQGGILVHAASAVRNGRAFLFAGVSGAGKTTIARLAPPDATLLTDEISYVRQDGDGYRAFGTPFAGELAKPGENISAPVAAVYFLNQGPENRIEAITTAEAGRTLLRNILFFAEDADLVKLVFDAACEFVSKVPVYRLTFVPDSRVWEAIG